MSIKKSTLIVLAVVITVTLVSMLSGGGNAMRIDMQDSAISFSGIGDFHWGVPYEDILSAELANVPDWSIWGGENIGYFRAEETESYVLFLSTQTDRVIIATLADGRQLVFNYNNASNTEALYDMLLQNIS